MFVKVYNNDLNKALSSLKKKINEDGLHKEIKERRFYEKPSDQKRREKAIAVRREKRKREIRLQQEGY